jgi:protein-tyrosine phosphatase
MKIAQAVPSAKEIANFGWVEPWLARGAEPKIAGYKWLAAHGFKTVVNLRSQDLTPSVRRAAPELEPIHLPIENDCAPTQEQAVAWLEICSSPYLRPIFVHCRAGGGRTSTLCAMLRLVQGRSLDWATIEQFRYGFNPDGDNREQERFLRRFLQHRAASGTPK